MNKVFPVSHNQLLSDVLHILHTARQKAYSAINTEMVNAYWLLGKRIVEEEQKGERRAAYGEEILKNLSIALNNEFGKGFSYSNLRNFRQFYLTYPDSEICYTLCSKLSWSHNRLIMRVESADARTFYLKESLTQNWSVRALERNITSFYFQRILSHQTNTDASIDYNIEKADLKDFIKDPYVFEFLNIPEPQSAKENVIETALIENLQHFLLELGKGFSFVGKQMRISTETSTIAALTVAIVYLFNCMRI